MAVFATHYYELVELEATISRTRNYRVEVAEYGNEIVFLKRVSPGVSDRSYGIHVARLAGLPKQVIDRAQRILQNLETAEWNPHLVSKVAPEELASERAKIGGEQTVLFTAAPPHRVIQKLVKLELDDLSPKKALKILYEMQDDLGLR
jgi:DNA mismatch repair protein MutS